MKALNKMLIRDGECDLFRSLKVGVRDEANEVTHLFLLRIGKEGYTQSHVYFDRFSSGLKAQHQSC